MELVVKTLVTKHGDKITKHKKRCEHHRCNIASYTTMHKKVSRKGKKKATLAIRLLWLKEGVPNRKPPPHEVCMPIDHVDRAYGYDPDGTTPLRMIIVLIY